ncbi:aminoglycoside phosphotransferase family protein [Streptomyces asiaticus]|uniref:aminoglycoside phosphotransferase family protein n=1 Tax=Streptomyces asiaticus TaxID=114695 RepID=UPI003D71814C
MRFRDLSAVALYGVAPPPRPPCVLRGRCEEAFARVGRRLSEPAIGARIDVTAWSRAMQRCERLLDTQATTVLLHGDLHLGNVLGGGAGRGLMAIDPKACVGDPCIDAVDYVVAGAGLEGVETRCPRVRCGGPRSVPHQPLPAPSRRPPPAPVSAGGRLFHRHHAAVQTWLFDLALGHS